MDKITETPIVLGYSNFHSKPQFAPCTDNVTVYTGPLAWKCKHSKGQATPGYHRRKALGELIPATPWYQFEGDYDGGSHEVQLSTANSTCKPQWYHDPGPYPRSGVSVTEQAIGYCPLVFKDPSAALNSLAASVAGAGFDLLTWAAELRSTIDLFKRTGDRLMRIVDKKPPYSSWHEPWLEWRYGWRLLYYDALNLQKAYELSKRKVHRFKRNQTFNTDSKTEVFTNVYNQGYGTLTITTTNNWSIEQKVGLVADIRPNVVRINPLLTAWELVPYSFIVDWFLPIGDLISAWEFLTLQSGYTAWHTTVTTLSSTTTRLDLPKAGYEGWGKGYCTGNGKWVVRTPSTVGAFPGLTVNLNVAKVVDLVALIQQRLTHSH